MSQTRIGHRQGLAERAGWPLLAGLALLGLGSGCSQGVVVPPAASISQPPQRLSVPRDSLGKPAESFPSDGLSNELNRKPSLSGPSLHPWKPVQQEREWKHVVLHHSATASGDVESIHRDHLQKKDGQGNHWLGIGYHFVIGNGNGMEDGEVAPTFRWKDQIQGAHAGVAEFNQQGVGIVLIGNFEDGPPSSQQLAATRNLVRWLLQEYDIPSSRVIGHGDVKATECPGKFFPLAEFRDSLAVRDARRFPHVAVSIRNPSQELNP